MHLNHVTLIASDFEESVAFYRTLGLQVVVHEPPRYARLVCPDGDATLSVEVTGEAPAPPRAQLFFQCEELDATCERLRAAGVEFRQPPTDMPYLWREARLVAPDGHDVRLYWAGRNRLDPPWKVNA